MKPKTFLIVGIISSFISCNQNQSTENQPESSSTVAEKSTTEQNETSAVHSLSQASADVNFHPEYVRSMARLAYIWGYPLVNSFNRRNAFRQIPEQGRLNGVLPVAPIGHIEMLTDYIKPQQRSVACPNQDVAYGYGFFELDKQPVVIQVPDFGDRFWVYALYDARTEKVGSLGKMYSTKPGFYFLHGPNWKGDIPAGITEVLKSKTELVTAIPRVFMDDTDEDRKAIQSVLNQVIIYPATDFDGKMKTKDWKATPDIKGAATQSGETKWVVPEKFFDVLPDVLKNVSPLPGEEALYGQFNALLQVAAKDPAIKKIMVDEVVALDKNLLKDFLQWKYNGKPAGNGWNRSQNNAAWGLDYYNRTGSACSNIFDNAPNETQYFYTDFDSKSGKLNGSKNYKVTFAKGETPPVNGFWSMTLYNAEHFFHPNPLNRYSLGTKNKSMKENADGSLTLYVGSKSPGADKESNWVPAPNGDFSLYIRAYWGKDEIINGTWMPPAIEQH